MNEAMGWAGPRPSTAARTEMTGTAPLGLSFRGACLTSTGKNEDARTFFTAALKKEPNNVDAHFWMGRLLFAEQQYEPAAAEFQKAGQADPTYRLAWHMAGAAENQAGDELPDSSRLR